MFSEKEPVDGCCILVLGIRLGLTESASIGVDVKKSVSSRSSCLSFSGITNVCLKGLGFSGVTDACLRGNAFSLFSSSEAAGLVKVTAFRVQANVSELMVLVPVRPERLGAPEIRPAATEMQEVPVVALDFDAGFFADLARVACTGSFL